MSEYPNDREDRQKRDADEADQNVDQGGSEKPTDTGTTDPADPTDQQ
jgi:hypothetical protein